MCKTIITATEFCCTGCEACVQKCPIDALTMMANSEGFFYPALNQSLCIGCGLCTSVCPIASPESIDRYPLPKMAFVGTHRDRDTLLKSASGGAFSAIVAAAEPDVIYGAAWETPVTVTCTRVIPERLAQLRTSKYVQARIGSAYKQVQQDLSDGKKVLFSGTPCQIAGLLSFLGNRAENLITVEVICHGVSSPKLFQEYCCDKSHLTGSPIRSFDFRVKSPVRGDWESFHTVIKYENGKTSKSFYDPFTQLFLSRTILRQSCGDCPFACTDRASDFVIGDYWGCDTQRPAVYDRAGVSVILPITEQGRALCKKLWPFLEPISVPTADITRHNHVLLAPNALNQNRAAFFSMVTEKGTLVAIRQFAFRPNWKQKLKTYLLPLLRECRNAWQRLRMVRCWHRR